MRLGPTMIFGAAVGLLAGCGEQVPRVGEEGGECRLDLTPCDEGLVCRDGGCREPAEPGEGMLPELDAKITLLDKRRLQADGRDATRVQVQVYERLTGVQWGGVVRLWIEPPGAGRVNPGDELLELDAEEEQGAVTIFTACEARDPQCPPKALLKVAPFDGPLVTIGISRTIRLVGGGSARPEGPNVDFSMGCGKSRVVLVGDDTEDLRDPIHPGAKEYELGQISVRDAEPETVRLSYVGDPETEASVTWDLDFSTRGLGGDLQVATYDDARRYPFESNGAGLNISGSGHACDRLVGLFTVHAVEFDANRLQVFDASFVQHCEGGEAALRGCVRYER